jgi:excisionase family DNA binding protein
MAKRQRTIDLSSEAGPPLTTGELARVTGVSDRTVRRDIELGYLNAVKRNGIGQYRIAWLEARRYAAQLMRGAVA